jgi:SAM-dependent methyltransferase
MRAVTRQVAFEPGGWTPERAAKVAALFDDLAGEWHTRDHPRRIEPLTDALDRGGPFESAVCLEVGSGTGLATPTLVGHFNLVVSIDLSSEMLRRAPADVGVRVLADSATLPVRAKSADAVVLFNMLLFPHEVDRVLAPTGAVVWVNTSGDRTPIHLPADDVAAALPGEWDGVHAEAGWGTWAVLRRA